MAKATTTIKQVLTYQTGYSAWFAANQVLFNRVVAFYFGVIQAHEKVLDFSNKDALTALEKLTHTTQKNPTPVMPLEDIRADIPALFRRAAINAALGSARSFYSHLSKWRKCKEKTLAKGKQIHRAPTHSATLVEQVSHPLWRAVEGTYQLVHCAQSVDWHVLELDQGSSHWSGNTRRCRGRQPFHLSGAGTSGGCTLPLKSHSGVPPKSRNKLPQTHKQRSVQQISI